MQRYADGTPCLPDSSSSSRYPTQSHRHNNYAPYPFAPPTTSFRNVPNPYSANHPQQRQPSSIFAHTIFEDEQPKDEQSTTDLNQHVRKARPRKRVSLMPNKDRQSIAIHEDATAILPKVLHEDATITRGLTLGNSGARRQSIAAQSARRRRVSAILADRLGATDENATQQREKSSGALKKEARRRTIYIPDDTTVDTIHPGIAPAARQPRDDTVRGLRRAKSPDVGLDLVTLSEGPESPYPVLKYSETGVKKKAPRKSLAIPPKRAPLGLSKRTQQTVSFAEDIVGAPTGKENLVPSTTRLNKPAKPLDDLSKTRLSIAGLRDATPEKSRYQARMNASLAEVVASSPGKRKGTDSILEYGPRATKLKTSRAVARAETVVGRTLSTTHASVRFAATVEDAPESPEGSTQPTQKAAHASFTTSVLEKSGSQPIQQYQVISEDLAHPSLYEDHWLEHQEISLTQLLNDIFEPQAEFKEPQNTKDLRKRFLVLYHDPAVPLIHKRLQASLLYGALSIPKDLLGKASRVRDDVGLKRKFLDLWVENYDVAALRASLEAIVGREVPHARSSCASKAASNSSHSRNGLASSLEVNTSRLSTGSNPSETTERKTRSERKALERFIEIFLLRHEDAVRTKGTIGSIAKAANQNGDDFGSPAWCWRRTVLKSLMLILLLDKAKSNKVFDGNLFQATSSHKSSASVLASLGQLLLPSLGDVARSLGHLNYVLSAVQYPLQEYVYNISSLATDLRDGVKLTRLVELMLFDKNCTSSTVPALIDNTVTLSLPGGDSLTSSWSSDPSAEWVLSQHLKVPCIGRPQKLYNVQISLSALSTLGAAAAEAAEGITAEDIVDGHRERTLSLLWAIVGYHGLGTFVDWRELKREIRHFRFLARANDSTDGLQVEPKDATEAVERTPSLKRCTKLLLAWAQSIAVLQGLEVTNLTTSFADARVLGSLVDAYLPYFSLPTVSTTTGLSAKMKAIGCSDAFVELYSGSVSSSMPSKSFTVSTLTFLASRLLPLSRTHRAATMIQRVFRRHKAERNITRRVALARLAHHCAVVVQTRNKVVGAATTLQRAWRRVVEARMQRIVDSVVALQAAARGWTRREMIKGGGVVKARRVIAGW